jgi:hypothetical protein
MILRFSGKIIAQLLRSELHFDANLDLPPVEKIMTPIFLGFAAPTCNSLYGFKHVLSIADDYKQPILKSKGIFQAQNIWPRQPDVTLPVDVKSL